MTDESKQTGESAEPSGRQGSEPRAAPGAEPVWTYRGYQLRPSEFSTAMVHFFRAEVQRANVWRQRLDTTTNWAVVATGAAISFAFSQATASHSVIILNIMLITLFLYIEARRYRYYELWSYRVRLMETDFFATMLVPPFHPSPDWAESLAENLLHPHFPISLWEALGRRFRRNYAWIYVILDLAWTVKVGLAPVPVSSWAEFVTRAAIGGAPGWLVLAVGIGFNGLLLLIGVVTAGLQRASGEILPRYGTLHLPGVTPPPEDRAWFRPSGRRQQLMALIVTAGEDGARRLADRILSDMRRGVTAMPGMGMYTSQPHSVLMVALTVTEVNRLKVIVQAEDPKAFVIVTPVHDILGTGFAPLREKE